MILSKCFLLGEYSVLSGGPGIVLAHEPKFEIAANEIQYHPDSPAGRLLQGKGGPKIIDPHHGRGGFGASTAEFIAAWKSLGKNQDAWEAWRIYRELHSEPNSELQRRGQKQLPSGADLLAQMSAQSNALVYIDFTSQSLEMLPTNLPILILRTGNKLKTHEHLAKLKWSAPESLAQLTLEGWRAIKENNLEKLGNILVQYQEILAAAGLLFSESAKFLESLKSLPIYGAKACGAMGFDALVVLYKPGNLPNVLQTCQGLNLEVVWYHEV